MNHQNGGTTGSSLLCPKTVEDEDESPPKHVPITVAKCNICSGHAGCLDEVALQAADQMNLDLGILMETKLTDDVHARSSLGHQVTATGAPSAHQRGVALFFRESQRWQVESVVKHGPNVVSFELVSG